MNRENDCALLRTVEISSSLLLAAQSSGFDGQREAGLTGFFSRNIRVRASMIKRFPLLPLPPPEPGIPIREEWHEWKC